MPAWGSATRIVLPPPASLSLGDLGAFGAHQGGHPEGLDHVWLYKTTDNQVQSCADWCSSADKCSLFRDAVTGAPGPAAVAAARARKPDPATGS